MSRSRFLTNLLGPSKSRDLRISALTICRAVSRQEGVSVHDILVSRKRTKPVAMARHEAIYRMREKGFSLPQIGRVFGRDHTSILNSIRRAEQARRAGGAALPRHSTPQPSHPLPLRPGAHGTLWKLA